MKNGYFFTLHFIIILLNYKLNYLLNGHEDVIYSTSIPISFFSDMKYYVH